MRGCIIDGLSALVSPVTLELNLHADCTMSVSGDDSGILKREIQSIQELLDEQPDSKCLFAFIYCIDRLS